MRNFPGPVSVTSGNSLQKTMLDARSLAYLKSASIPVEKLDATGVVPALSVNLNLDMDIETTADAPFMCAFCHLLYAAAFAEKLRKCSQGYDKS